MYRGKVYVWVRVAWQTNKWRREADAKRTSKYTEVLKQIKNKKHKKSTPFFGSSDRKADLLFTFTNLF